jgi:hypothetical protein
MDSATFRAQREKEKKEAQALFPTDRSRKKPKKKVDSSATKGRRAKTKNQNINLSPQKSTGALGLPLGPAELKQERASTVTAKDLEDKRRLAELLSKVGRVFWE